MNAKEVKAAIDIPLENKVIKKGDIITVSKRKYDHVLCDGSGWYALDNAYIGETIRIISED